MKILTLAAALTFAGFLVTSEASAAVIVRPRAMVVRPRAAVVVRPARWAYVAPAPVIRPVVIRPAARPVVRAGVAIHRHRVRYVLNH